MMKALSLVKQRDVDSNSQHPRMCSIATFPTGADSPLSKSLAIVPKEKNSGRPARQSSLRKGKGSDGYYGLGGDGDWVDEPEVCAFCDDGVENSERLICCDGPCMRSFYPTINSGRKNKCVQHFALQKQLSELRLGSAQIVKLGSSNALFAGSLGNQLYHLIQLIHRRSLSVGQSTAGDFIILVVWPSSLFQKQHKTICHAASSEN